MKYWLLVLVFLFSSSAARGQAGQATEIKSGPTNPTTCNVARGWLFWNTTTSTMNECSATNTWTAVGGASAINTPGTAGPFPQAALYTVGIAAGLTYARNNSTGLIDYSNADAGIVINSILTNNTSTCGTVHFKQGDYNFNSMTLESTGGYTNFYYAVGIPSNAGSANQYCQWIFEGEQNMYRATTVPQTQGTIFDVTAAGITSCGSGHECIAWWHRPDTTNRLGNDIQFKYISTRFPDNQRGNEAAYLMWEAATIDYRDTTANVNSNVTLAAVAGANHMIGLSSTMSSHNNWEKFINTTVVGYDIAYDIESEHSWMESSGSFEGNTFVSYGRTNTFGSATTSAIFHPSVWLDVTDSEDINGIVLGANVAQGTRLDIIGLDIETTTTGAWTRSTFMTETNTGFTSGEVTYTVVSANSGIISETPANQLFSSGGANFQIFESTSAPNIAKNAASDLFTRPNVGTNSAGTTVLGIGPAWLTNATGSQCGISSNTVITAASGFCIASYVAQGSAPDQFARITVSTVGSVSQVGALVRASSTVNTQTYYEYDCSTSGGAPAKRRIGKEVSAVFTSLVTTAANSGCSAGDTMELWAVGSTLMGFYTPSGGARTLDVITTDTSITTGLPGINVFTSSTANSSLTNFFGGSLPSSNLVGALAGQAQFAPQYFSIGTVPTPTGTGACATITTQVPSAIGSQAGTLKCTGTTGASTITLTFALAAPNGYRCSADDETTVADRPSQTSSTATTCVMTTAATVQNDVIAWNASPF